MAAYVFGSAATRCVVQLSTRQFNACSTRKMGNILPAAKLSTVLGYQRRAFSVSPAAAADTAQHGDSVQVHYTGKLDSGEVFDTSRTPGRSPLSFTIGAGQVIKGFDVAVTGLGVGESRQHRIEPQDAYGVRDDKLTARVPIDRCPPGLEVGVMVELPNGLPAKVTDVTESEVEIDANHRLAGEPLTFDVELVELKKAT